MNQGETGSIKERLRAVQDGTLRFLRNRFFWGGLAALVVIGLIAYLSFDRILMPNVTRHGVAVEVPDVVNLEPDSARMALADAGLSMEQQVLRRLNLPRNQVIDQRPTGGSLVKPGRSIYVTVNTGDTTTVVVPSVVGRSSADVPGLLRDAGLRAGTPQPDSIRSNIPQDAISRQLPRAQVRVPRGSQVRLWYSTGPSAEFVVVPSVAGLQAPEAAEKLRELGLRSVILGPGDGVVRDQGPTAGTTVREGSEVRLRTRDLSEGGAGDQ